MKYQSGCVIVLSKKFASDFNSLLDCAGFFQTILRYPEKRARNPLEWAARIVVPDHQNPGRAPDFGESHPYPIYQFPGVVLYSWITNGEKSPGLWSAHLHAGPGKTGTEIKYSPPSLLS
jgi:hypothetical protein